MSTILKLAYGCLPLLMLALLAVQPASDVNAAKNAPQKPGQSTAPPDTTKAANKTQAPAGQLSPPPAMNETDALFYRTFVDPETSGKVSPPPAGIEPGSDEFEKVFGKQSPSKTPASGNKTLK